MSICSAPQVPSLASIGANLLVPFASSGSSQIKDRTFLGGGVFVGMNFGNFQ